MNQPGHLVDGMPTVLQLTRAKYPARRNGSKKFEDYSFGRSELRASLPRKGLDAAQTITISIKQQISE